MKKKLYVALALCILSFLGVTFARFVPGFANGYYKLLYRPISTLLAFLFGLFKISVVELILYGLLLYVIVRLSCFLYRKLRHQGAKKKGKGKETTVRVITNVAFTVSILLLVFVMNCGINYYKTGFASEEGYQAKQYETKELITACNTLTKEINNIQSSLSRDKQGNLQFSEDSRKLARRAMENIGGTYKSLSGYYPMPKPLMNSSILSYQHVTGIYSPFTVEANYNDDTPEYLKSFVMCHELSHLKGIMREEEANFVAFIACDKSQDATVRYSGLMHAYTYCMNELYERDKETFVSIRKQLNDNSNHDINEKEKFWEKYDTKIATIANKMNDTYLKVNAQSEGVDSYDSVTGLIVDYYQKK